MAGRRAECAFLAAHHYSSLCSWLSSVSATIVFTTSAASATLLATFSATLGVLASALALDSAGGASVAALVTIDSGLGTPSMLISSVSKTRDQLLVFLFACPVRRVLPQLHPPPSFNYAADCVADYADGYAASAITYAE